MLKKKSMFSHCICFKVIFGVAQGEKISLLFCISTQGNVYLLGAKEERVKEKRKMSEMNNKMIYKQKQIYCDTFPPNKPDNVSQMCWLDSEPK